MLPVARILCPTDFSQPAMKALDVAGELALHFGAELIVLHVVHRVPLAVNPDDVFDFDVMSYEDQLHGSFERSLRQVVSEMKAKPVATRLIAVRGEAAEEIVRCVKKEKVDLLVISTQGRTGLGRLVFGSVAEKVLRLAACPVLVIKVHSEETGEAREPKPSTPSPEEEDKSHRKMIEQQVRELKTKFDELKSAFEESKAEGKKKYRTQIEELRGKGEEAQKKLETLKESGGEAWEEIKGGLSDLKDAFDRAMSKFREAKEESTETLLEKRKDYEKKVEDELGEFASRIDMLRAKAEASAGEAKKMFLTQVERLESSEKALRGRLESLRGSGLEAWDDVRKGLDGALGELRKALKDALSRFHD